MNTTKPRIAVVASITGTFVGFGRGKIAFLKQHGFSVDCIAADTGGVDSILAEGADYFEVGFQRKLSPFADIKVLWDLYRIFRQQKPVALHLMTLKPGFLGSLAGRLAVVPVIVRFKQGDMWSSNYRSLKRLILLKADKLANSLSHKVIAICHGLKKSEIEHGAVNPDKIVVFGSGSSSGINIERFTITPGLRENGRRLREHYAIPQDGKVIGTAMRINIEKGICELIEAFLKLRSRKTNLHLIIVGDYDIRNQPPDSVKKTISDHPAIHLVGWRQDIENYYAIMDVFVMPSYREGFCNTNIEAGAMGLPVVSTDIIGCNESILDGKTGLLVPVRTVDPLIQAIEKLLEDRDLAKCLAESNRRRIQHEFSNELVWHYQLKDLCLMLMDRGVKPPVDPERIIGRKCPLCTSGS